MENILASLSRFCIVILVLVVGLRVDRVQQGVNNISGCQCDSEKIDELITKSDAALAGIAALIQVEIDKNNEIIDQYRQPQNFTKPTDIYGWFTPEHENLLYAIAMVESGGDPNAVGDNGNALGMYQIWNSFWTDAVEHTPEIGGNYENVTDPEYAMMIILSYWDRYGERVDYSLEGLARIVNGGPRGFEKQATEKYWQKVEQFL